MKTKTIIFFDPNILHHNVNTFSDMAHHLLSAAGVSFTSRIRNTKHLILFLDPGQEQVSGNVTAVEARDFLNKLIARDQGVIYVFCLEFIKVPKMYILCYRVFLSTVTNKFGLQAIKMFQIKF